MKKYKCLIRGAYGAYNFGDDALLDVIYTKLLTRFEPAEIGIWGSSESYIPNWYPQAGVISKKDLYKVSCENLIYGGGTQFYDFGKPRNKKQILGFLKSPGYAFNKIQNKLFNSGKKPVEYNNEIYMAVGLGPFKEGSKIKEDTLRRMERAKFVALRDEKSIAYAATREVDIIQTVDLCLSKEVDEGAKDSGRIAVILRDWAHTDSDYTIEHLYAQLSQLDLTRVDFVTFGKDSQLKEFIKDKGLSLYEWDPSSMTLDTFLKKLGRYEMIFSSRYHGVIYSVLLGVPVVALPIEPKLIQASKELDGVLLFDPNKRFTDYVDLITDNYENIVSTLLETKKSKNQESNKTINLMLESL
ncbi:hypothetical protein PRUB_a2933 [Pseudoalteromonas rubra]|uniref:Polysaccharide pyruvyl transferase domain-containing protein n=1 Tax=Pseudoalteromonas rubra TaxID=43658 RepID=A0A8T0CC29_9GAMM|nr:polysaccharide pyruvyl transferase family protein [Pseudoalteromonas rubra]KAF7788307.1 hypothetical protein PRUB_a2933 [Pseudoalteromonas rubra]